MTDADEALLARAEAARARAYAPYSNYFVGAALVVDGEIYEGANVENVSYPAGMCAERAAIAVAVAAGARTLETVAVATQSSPPAAPCGMCLQTLIEFAPDPAKVRVLLANQNGERDQTTLAALLPRGFSRAQLTGKPRG